MSSLPHAWERLTFSPATLGLLAGTVKRTDGHGRVDEKKKKKKGWV